MVLSLFLWKPLLGPLGIFLTAWGVQWIHNEIPEATIRGLWPTIWPAWIQVLLLVILKDLLRYWFHRWMHENAFLWRLHSVHHSSTRLYWFNGVRSHPLESFVQETLWFIPLAFIQAPAEIVFAAGILSLTIGRFQHTNMNARLGIFEYIFSGPMNHRYHHAKDAENGNKNYGGDVILWDHLFGTFHLPKGREPSDDIGVGHMPDFPQNVIGLTLAPFRIRMWREAAERKKAALARGEKL